MPKRAPASVALTRRLLGRIAASVLVGLGLESTVTQDIDARKGRRKRVSLCLDGQTIRASKKRRRQLRNKGATRGACPTCMSADTLCGATCVNLQSAPNHCGRCGNACPAGEVCAQGTCCIDSTPDALQQAINDAVPGSTIRLCPGTFRGTFGSGKDLILIGSGRGENGSTLEWQDVGIWRRLMGISEGATVTLQNLTLLGSTEYDVRLIQNYGSLVLENVELLNGSYLPPGAGGVENLGSLTLRNTHVWSCSTGVDNYGTLALEASTRFTENARGIINAGAMTVDADVVISGNETGLMNQDTGTATFAAGARVTGNQVGIVNGGGTVTLASEDIVTDNDADGELRNCEPVNTIPNCVG